MCTDSGRGEDVETLITLIALISEESKEDGKRGRLPYTEEKNRWQGSEYGQEVLGQGGGRV
jgi:hypothetical protein